MNFNISRIVIWFQKDDKPREIKFKKNKVNVITGSSSTGKSNILAIIDYCLLTNNPKIVIPVITEFATWFGLEFEVGGKTMYIIRKKPEIETPVSDVFMNDGAIPHNFFPSSTNIHINDARRRLDSLMGLKSTERRHPGILNSSGEDLTVSYRSFLIYNAITEGIMVSPYIFTDVNFFDSLITKSVTGQRYLFEVLLGIDNSRIDELSKMISALEQKKETQEKQNRAISRKTGAYQDKLNYLLSLCQKYELPGDWTGRSKSDDEFIAMLHALVDNLAPSETTEKDVELEKLTQLLNTKVVLLENMKRARKEYTAYLAQMDKTVDKLKPIVYLKEKLTQMGVSEWTDYVLQSFEDSLLKLRNADVKAPESAITEKAITDLEQEIIALKNSVLAKSKIHKLSIEKNNNLYYVVGVVKSELPELEKLRGKIPDLPEEYTTQDESNYHAYKEEKSQLESEAFAAYYRIDEDFAKIYGGFHFMEYFAGCKPKYNKEERRLELNNGRSILNYNNVGSQSNYMFLHLCFFLGLHRYLLNHPSEMIGQFLFVDQPSSPYYSGEKTVKTTDEAKLKDAFASLNNFMKYAIAEKGSDFQMILIEHAPPSYWDGLEYFDTTEQFVDGNALIPKEITSKQVI